MEKEKIKQHLIDVIDSMDMIVEFSIDREPLKVGKSNDGWLNYTPSPIIKIEIKGYKELK